MPSLTRVARHIVALIEADPANADRIRAMLPAAETEADERLQSGGPVVPPRPMLAINNCGICGSPEHFTEGHPAAAVPQKRAAKKATAATSRTGKTNG